MLSLGVGELSVEELKNMTLSAADIPATLTRETVDAKNHVLRLREQEADLNTVVFQNRDGGKTVYLFGSPVKYVDENGNIRDKSTTLISENVTVNGKTYSHSATDNFFGQYYSALPSNGVMLAFGNHTVEMTPVITSVLTLRDTVVSDNKVTYNKVFGTGTQLVYTPTLNGVKEDIILSAYTGKSAFSFTLKTNGLAVVQQNGETVLVDFDGNTVASLGEVIITDSANKTVYGTMTVVTKTEFEEYTVTVNAPVEFLTSPTTVYPVTVDPTLTIDEGFTPDGVSYDAYIEDLCIYNGGSSPILNNIAGIGNFYFDEDTGTAYQSRMLYRITSQYANSYGLSSYLTSSRFDGASLFVKGNAVEYDITVDIYPYLGTWLDGTAQAVNNFTFESYETDYKSTTVVSNYSNQTIEFDLTKVFNYFIDDLSGLMQNGFILKVRDESTGDEACYDQIKIHQIEHPSSTVYIGIDYDMPDDEYYINNENNGSFLKSNGNGNDATTNVYANSSSLKWNPVYAGSGSYYLTSSDNSNLVLYFDGASVKVGTKPTTPGNEYKWQNHTAFDIQLDSEYTEVGLWDYTYEGHVYGEVLNLVIEIEDGLINKCFPSGNSNLFYNAITRWNDLCSNVRIYLPGDDLPDDTYYLVKFISPKVSAPDFMGRTLGILGSSQNYWQYCTIELNYTQTSHSSILMQKIITHEMGHALMLSHPEEGEFNEKQNVLSVMNQGDLTSSENPRVTLTPTTRDVYFLNLKWG